MRILVIVAIVAGCGEEARPLTPIEIGFLAPQTGDLAAFGRDLTDASSLALEEINDDGGVLGGRELRLEVIDTGTSGTGATIAYTTLLNRQMPVILGPTASSECVAVREQIKAGTTLTLSQSATSPQLGSLDFGGYLFRMAPSDAIQAVVLAEQITQRAPAMLCALHRDDPYGKGLVAAIKSRVTIPVIEAKFDPAQADLSAVLDPCDPLIPADDSALLVVTLIADGAALINDAARRGWTRTKHDVFLTDGQKSRDFLTLLSAGGSDFVDGAIGTAPTGPDQNTPDGAVLRDFRTRFRTRFGRESDVYAEMAYDAVYVAALGIEIANTAEDRTAIRDAMARIGSGRTIPVSGDWGEFRDAVRADGEVDYRGASGEVLFDATTGETRGPFFISVWTISNGAVVETSIRRVDPL